MDPWQTGSLLWFFNGTLIDQSNRIVTSGISLLSTTEPSSLGSDIESVESIKKYSTQIFASKIEQLHLQIMRHFCQSFIQKQIGFCLWWGRINTTTIWKSFIKMLNHVMIDIFQT